MLSLVKSGPATFEAITVAELKAHCRISYTADDTYLETLRIAAREQVEHDLNLAIAGQSWIIYTDSPFTNTVTLSIQPVQSITSVKYTDENHQLQTLSSGHYELKAYRDEPQIEFTSDVPKGSDVSITVVAGFADDTEVPALVKAAIMFLASNWYENREPVVVGSTVNPVPLGYQRIIDRLRVSRFR